MTVKELINELSKQINANPSLSDAEILVLNRKGDYTKASSLIEQEDIELFPSEEMVPNCFILE